MKTTLRHIQQMAEKFVHAQNLRQLGQLIRRPAHHIALLSSLKDYHVYEIPKPGGDMRLIEEPAPALKNIQQAFNRYLQAVYFVHQTPPAYGYVIHPKNHKPAKNILTNAMQHMGHPYVLKVDLEDFFHQIHQKRVFGLFRSHPFRFEKQTASVLSSLFTFRQRLPMGAPTSPVLSNFATIGLDHELHLWAMQQGITFTRFADDMTFSAQFKIKDTHLQQIRAICQRHQYRLNEEKTAFLGPDDTKIITGLVVGRHEVDIEPAFYEDLRTGIERLKHLIEAGLLMHSAKENELIVKMKQQVRGMLNFLGMIKGYHSDVYTSYKQLFDQALHPGDDALFIRWNYFHYL